ncbi:peptidoglycan hydrolase [Phytoactinopolyspora alkaliphila]|uniref:Peptidoglycan hydrolase n=1 Tax=Phytoactinopolyspora alkaliphila TaxID=1783498 RepID=A0A6N9YU75_9ACTN|nr:glycosyl hydrolase family 18 protein [Phytoactinopolyspora alkaliphila]NED98525.1 peptidoglycan hydrolase [Phytoactinopolyspora alkaliphila]
MTRVDVEAARHSGRWTRRRPLTVVAVVVSAAIVGLLIAMALSDRDGSSAGSRERPEVTLPMRIGYVPYWDQERGFDTALLHLDFFHEVSPVWYSLKATGRIVLADAENTTVDLRTVRYLQARGIRVTPTITNLLEGEWNPGVVQAMLHDPRAVRRHVRELVELAVTQDYDGIDIDYEDLRAVDRERFSEFLGDLAAALHAEDKVLTVAVHPKVSDEGYDERNQAQDYRAIGAAVDQVRVMTYEYSWETSPPGPVAPADWVDEVIEWTLTEIPREKVILGVVLLGYDWSEGRGGTIGFEEARALAREHGVPVRRSADGSPSFTYEDSAGRRHEVWYEDAVSVRAKVAIASRHRLGGVFFWRLGGEDPHVWAAASDELQPPRNGYR